MTARSVRAWLIRLRQEVSKRTDAGLAWAGLPRDGGALELGRNRHGTLEADLTGLGWPGSRLTLTPDAAPPDRTQILREADDVMEGRFDVFGTRLEGFGRSLDWTVDPVTGRPTPPVRWHRFPYLGETLDSDIKLLWELNRHHHLVRLAQAYHLTHGVRYTDRLRWLLERWMDQNPPGVGVNWASTLEVAIRAVAWCWIWVLTRDAAFWTATYTDRFLRQVQSHARHIARYDSTHHSPNTHLTGEAVGLLYIAHTFRAFNKAQVWDARARRILRTEGERQVLGDGMHFERSTCYHRYTLEFYLHATLLTSEPGGPIDPQFGRLLERLRKASRALQRPDGSWPVLGDEDGGRLIRLGTDSPTDQEPILRAVDTLLDGGEVGAGAECTDAIGAEAWWLLGTGGVSSERSSRGYPTAVSLPETGYFVGRDDGAAEGWYVLVDAGPLGALSGGHGHADLGHVEIAHGPKRLICDSGSGVYAADPELRSWFRGERAHARPSLQGLSLAREAGPFGWHTVPPEPDLVLNDTPEAWTVHLRYQLHESHRVVDHSRHLVLVRGAGVVVVDWFTGLGALAGEMRWPLSSSEAPHPLAEMRFDVWGEPLEWSRLGRVKLRTGRVEPAVRAETYGEVRQGAVITGGFEGDLPFGVLTTIGRARVRISDDGEGKAPDVVWVDSSGRTHPVPFQNGESMGKSEAEILYQNPRRRVWYVRH